MADKIDAPIKMITLADDGLDRDGPLRMFWVEVSPTGETSFDSVAMFHVYALSREDAEAKLKAIGQCLAIAPVHDGILTCEVRDAEASTRGEGVPF